ncbi:MAG: hypothetical protein JWM27_2415 [Gemmatimonadetes bacterium]|nr:hypothetical protein [Gemmatimonadota bacterium]
MLREFYRNFRDQEGTLGAEKKSRIGHETMRTFINEKDEPDAGGKRPHPFNPRSGTILDFEAFFWRQHDLQEVRDDPDAPLPPDDVAALRAILSAERDAADAEIRAIGEAMEAQGQSGVKAVRLMELLRRMWEEGEATMPSYGTAGRKRKKPEPPPQSSRAADPPDASAEQADAPDEDADGSQGPDGLGPAD